MKKLLSVAVIFLVAFTPLDLQNSVQQNVQRYIITMAETPKSYQPLSFGKVEKFMLHFGKTNVGRSYIEQAQVSMLMAKDYWTQAQDATKANKKDSLLHQMHFEEAEVEKYLHLYDSASKEYTPMQYGWKIYHKYRIKDYDGNYFTNEDTFYLDKRLRVVDTDTITGFVHDIDN